MKSLNFAFFFVALLAAPAGASSNLFLCSQDFGFVIGSCKLDAQVLAPRASWDGEPYEASFVVRYSFPCSGHPPQIGIASGDAFKEFQLGASDASIALIGSRELRTYDPNPRRTLDLSFTPGCQLVVHEVSMTPSADAVERWVQSAKLQAKIIDLNIHLAVLASDFSEYRDWDLARTRELLDSVRKKAIAFEEDCLNGNESACGAELHFKAIGNALQRRINQTPTLPDPRDLKEEASTVAAYYQQLLLTEVAAGERMLRRFRDFDQVIESTLNDALERAPKP